MENEPDKKNQNLLEGFVRPIDTGRLMGDTLSVFAAFSTLCCVWSNRNNINNFSNMIFLVWEA